MDPSAVVGGKEEKARKDTSIGRSTSSSIQPMWSDFFCFTVERPSVSAHKWGRGGERRWLEETQNLKQALGSELSAQSPTRGSSLQTVRSWPEVKSVA